MQDSWRAAWQKYVFSDDLISPEGQMPDTQIMFAKVHYKLHETREKQVKG